MYQRKPQCFRPAFERLEDRWTPDGSVTASVQNLLVGTVFVPTLVIRGDFAANGIDVSQTGFETYQVSGFTLTTATNINGAPNGQATFSGAQAISINTGGGNDFLTFGLFNNGEIDVVGNLAINTGAGNATVATFNGANFLRVFKDLSIVSGPGNVNYTFTNLTTVGAAKFTHTSGGNTSVNINANTAAPNVVGRIGILTGSGFLTVGISDTNSTGNVAIVGGPGGAAINVDAFNAFGSSSIGGSVGIVVSGLGFVTANVGDQTGAFNLTINGNLNVNLSQSNGGSNVEINNVSVGGSATLLGSANADTFGIQDITAGTTQFFGSVFVNLGGGNDILNLAADVNNQAGLGGAVVNFFTPASGSIILNGGGGLNQRFIGTVGTNVFFFAKVPSVVNFI